MATISLEKTLSLQLDQSTPYHFLVIGAGGTGGYLLPNLIRLIGVQNRARATDGFYHHSITVIDRDDIEEKNLLRQNFTPSDIGKNKAEVMAKRYGRAFGVQVGFVPDYITSPAQLAQIVDDSLFSQQNEKILGRDIEDEMDFLSNPNRYFRYDSPDWDYDYSEEDNEYVHERPGTTLVLIDATDNNKTRLILNEFMDIYPSDAITIFSGNESKAGQVLFSATDGFKEYPSGHHYDRLWEEGDYASSSLFLDKYTLTKLPTFFEVFPDAPIEKLPNELSCAEAAISAPQNIAANITAANIVFNFANLLLSYQPVRHFLVFFDVDSQAQKVYRLTKSDLRAALSLTPNNKNLLKYKLLEEADMPSEEELTEWVETPTWGTAIALKAEEDAKKQAALEAALLGTE